MAIGTKGLILGEDGMMDVHANIKGYPPPMKTEESAHFVQEYGEPVAHAALKHFGLV